MTKDELIIITTQPAIPTVDIVYSNTGQPILTGTADHLLNFGINVNGTNYISGVDPELTLLSSNQWTLDLSLLQPALGSGVYDVYAVSVDLAGNSSVDATDNELTVDIQGPKITVTPTQTNDVSPLITGQIQPGLTEVTQVTVEIPRKSGSTLSYTWTPTSSDPELTVDLSGPSSWQLDLTGSETLGVGIYDIDASIADQAGNMNVDPTDQELIINTFAPTVTVNAQATDNRNPIISGGIFTPNLSNFQVSILSETVDWTDPRLSVDISSNSWLLDTRGFPPLADGTYDVRAIATDLAGNVGSDATTNELIIAADKPVILVIPEETNNPSPTVFGFVDETVETISVTIDGNTWVTGDPALFKLGILWWVDLSIAGITLNDGVYDVRAIGTNAAGISGEDPSTDELVIDTSGPMIPTVDFLTTNDTTPTVTGTYDGTSLLGVALGGPWI